MAQDATTSPRRVARPDGQLIFQTRDPARRAWEEWTLEDSYRVTDIPSIGAVESWAQLIDVSRPLVTFRWTYRFAVHGQVLTTDSTLCFRGRDKIERDLLVHG